MSFWVAGATLVGTVGGALVQKKGADKAAGAQARSADAAVAEQQRQYDLYREDQAPYRQIGTGALNQLAALYGIPGYSSGPAPAAVPFEQWAAQEQAAGRPGDQASYDQYVAGLQTPPAGSGAPDYSGFYDSPDYAFGLEQGNQALQRAAAAGGGLASGNTLAAAQRYGQGYATQRFGDYRNSLASLAGIGQSATNATGQAGLVTGQGVADSLVGAGAARASGIAGGYNALGDAIGAGANAFGQWWQNRQTNQPVPAGHWARLP